MLFHICYFISAAIAALVALYALFSRIRPYSRRKLQPLHLLWIGVFVCALLLFFPIYLDAFSAKGSNIKIFLLSLIISLHNTIRLFIVDGEFSIVSDYTARQSGWVADAYNLLASVLFVAAPMLTFGAVLSFFENLTAHRRYFFKYCRDAYVFSELNERSLALARSLRDRDRKCALVFTGVSKNDEQTGDTIEQAKKLDAILFRNSLTANSFRRHSKKAKLYFFLIDDDETKNINQLIQLAGGVQSPDGVVSAGGGYDYPAEDNRAYLFSCQNNYDNLSVLFNTKYLKIRKINHEQALIYRLLYDHGDRIFDSAAKTGNMLTDPVSGDPVEEKRIMAAIVGLGLYGVEMLRALAWFCQLFPYRLEIAGFDGRTTCRSDLEALYPELLLPPHNHDFTTPGESHYGIDVYDGMDVTGIDFETKITSLPDVTYILVALGNDDLNIHVATRLRILFARLGKHPEIHTIVYNAEKRRLFAEGYAQKKINFDIFFCGDIQTTFSEQCILSSSLEREALEKKHMVYAADMKAEHAAKEAALQKEAVALRRTDRSAYRKKRAELRAAMQEHAAALTDYENSFWQIDYNYRSSTASVMHKKYKQLYALPGADKRPTDRTPAERRFYRVMEHQRWNAFVRSEGYVLAPERNKLLKTHHLLIPFDDLPLSEQEKDDD